MWQQSRREARLQEFISGFPPYFKYVVLTMVPWIELRGAIPWAVQQGDTEYLPLIAITNAAIFFPTYFILQWIYKHIPEGSWLHRKLERIREKAHPMVERYGLLGIAFFVAIPLPGTGAYSGSCAAWLLGVGWRRAFLGVLIGVLIAFALVWALSETIAFGVRVGTP
jgi:uncharacterized membrane protein